MTVQYAKLCGAVRVVSIDRVQKRVLCALESGATDGLVMDAKDAIPEIEKLLGAKPEVVFDATGNYEVLPIACNMAQFYGRVILNGDCPEPSRQCLGPVVSKSLEIHGTHGNKPGDIVSLPWVAKRNTQMNFDLMKQKRIKVKHLNTNRFKPEEAPDVYRRMFEDRYFTIGVLFDWQ